MRDFLTSRLLLAALIVGAGLIPPALADPPAPAPAPPPDPPPPPVAEAIEDLKPQPLPPIPDDPLPHEGAMIDYPITVDPSDLIMVEVLEALPGRPITGERLVRPDGTISLGFYGDFHVRGLMTRQIKIKIKIVERLKDSLPEEVLGLTAFDEDNNLITIAPGDTDRVFVEVTAYNSKSYYIEGDVANPGKLPWTGNETVLDAMHYAGGLIPSADPKNIRLVRPPRGGKPARVYPIDLEAIRDRGEIEENYQIFPGDRIIVGRNAVVATTLEMERFAAPMAAVFNSILQQTYAVRSLMLTASGGKTDMTPEQRETLVKEWTDLWWKLISRPAGAEFDEKVFREVLMRGINPPGTVKPSEVNESEKEKGKR